MRHHLFCLLLGISAHLTQAIPIPLDVNRLEKAMKDNLNVDPSTIRTQQSNPNGGGVLITAERNGPQSGEAANKAADVAAHEVVPAYIQSKDKDKPKGRGDKPVGPPMTTVDIGQKDAVLATQDRDGGQQSSNDAYKRLMEENTRENIRKSSDAQRYQDAKDKQASASSQAQEASNKQKTAQDMVKSASTLAEKQAAIAKAKAAGQEKLQAERQALVSDRAQKKLEAEHAHPGKCSECGADLHNVKQATQDANTAEDKARQAVEGHLQSSAGVTKANPQTGLQQACVNCEKKQANFQQTDAVAHPDATITAPATKSKGKKDKRALVAPWEMLRVRSRPTQCGARRWRRRSPTRRRGPLAVVSRSDQCKSGDRTADVLQTLPNEAGKFRPDRRRGTSRCGHTTTVRWLDYDRNTLDSVPGWGMDLYTVKLAARRAVEGHLRFSAGVTDANPQTGLQQADFEQTDGVAGPDATIIAPAAESEEKTS